MTPNLILFSLVVFALALLPAKYQPAWIYRLNWWQGLLGLIATVAALLVVMNPEFLALGLLGDSTFFDLLILAMSVQLQVILSRMGTQVMGVCAQVVRRMYWGHYVAFMLLALMVNDFASIVQRVLHRFTS